MDKQNEVMEVCPYCRCDAFHSDWSELDMRASPIELKEKYRCDDCGREFIQIWRSRGWESKDSEATGEGYLQKCIKCGCEDLVVQMSMLEDPVAGKTSETYRCDKCGAQHSQLWESAGWREIREGRERGLIVEDHERMVVHDGEESEMDGRLKEPVEAE
jgi:DNA-directed RNA polymerase subunit RPC12/RpoP